MPATGQVRLAVMRVGVLIVSLVVSVAAIEIVLRVRYQRSMLATIGGPGPHFSGRRGRLDESPKKPGLPRLMILGDSITFGQGLPDDADPWPERLARRFEREQKPVEMAVYAWPGRDIDSHEQQFAASSHHVQPDVFIYQWFVNDIESARRRPDNRRWWQRTAADAWLGRHSYLFFLLDTRLNRLLPPADRSYLRYLLDDYAPGTLEWDAFERTFHSLAARVDAAVPGQKLLVLYPVLPFWGSNPLQPIHDRMRALAGPHRMEMPTAAWTRLLAGSSLRRNATGHDVLSLPAAATGPAVSTRAFYPMHGPMEIVVGVSATTGSHEEVGRLELFDDLGQPLDSASLVVDAGRGEPRELTVHLDARGLTGHYVHLVLRKTAPVAMDVRSIGMQVDYRLRVVDPSASLNAFDTHVNIYDAHPSARAQQVVADAVYDALRGHP